MDRFSRENEIPHIVLEESSDMFHAQKIVNPSELIDPAACGTSRV